MPKTDLKGKTVIITGASSGIGAACAKAFALKGANVVLAARDSNRLEKTAAQIESPLLLVPTDVSVEADCKNLAEKTIEKFGRIDILINNAGISMRALFIETDLSVIKKVMDINFWGSVYCTRYALPEILKNQGSVIGISSIAGYKGLPARTGYSASKFALQGFLETIRIEHLKDSLHVMIVCPGFTASNIRKASLNKDGISQGESPRNESKMMTADEVASTVVKATVKRKRTLILTSQGKLTVLINKWFPAWMDKKVYEHLAKETDSPFK